MPFSLHGVPAPFRRRFPALPWWGHRRGSHADGHSILKVRCWNGNKKVATKQTGHAFAFSEGLTSRLCSDLKSQKGEPPSPVGTERISKICIKLLEWITTKSGSCQQKLLQTRYFRQSARKYIKNFSEKIEGWTVPALLTR